MQSNNPVLRNALNGQQTYAGNGQGYAGYGQQAPQYGAPQYGQQAPQYGQQYSDPSTWSTGTPGAPTGVDEGRMTMDSVVQKSAITFVLTVATAIATWVWIGNTGGGLTDAQASRLLMLLGVGTGAAFILSLVNSFKRVISPALVLAFAAAEGVALGAISKYFDVRFGDGIVSQAVLGTFAAFAGTLVAYKFLNIQVGQRFRAIVTAAMFGMVGLGLLSLVLSFFGIYTGLYGMGTLGLIMAIAGLVLGVLMLVMDFDSIERGIAAGLPQRESWRMAFALLVSLVWIYTNLLRILAILRND